VSNQTPSDPTVLTRDEVLLALDTAMGTIATARMLIAKNWPEDAALVMETEQQGCPHEHRAPSMPSFCLDCETDLDDPDGGVSGQ
jgi:hypothetical protein